MPRTPYQDATPSEGGVWHDFSLRSTTATFVYMTHSAVVSHFEKALPLKTREKGGGRERPPQKQGGYVARYRWHLWHASVPAPMGSLTSSFIPAGRLRTAAQERR